MGRRVLNRKGMRDDFDAAERRQQDNGQDEAQDEAEDSDEEDEEEGEVAETEAEAGDADEAEVVAAKSSKKRKAPVKPKASPKPKAKPRSRVVKVARMKVVWGVFNNSNQRVAVFEYPRRQDADVLAAKLKADKKTTHFVQAVKEPIEEKKDEKK